LALAKAIQALHERGFVYASEQQNAVFLMRGLNGETRGAFLRGTRGKDNTFMGYEKGSKRTDGWFWFGLGGQPNGEIQRAVLCKSPIEALSLATFELEVEQEMLKERTMYLAVDSPRSLPVDFLKTFLQE
jgi:Protein of unknown function (DUF3991)